MARFVDFDRNIQDRAARMMIEHSEVPFTTECISNITRLRKGQVSYRRTLLRKWTMDDRRGRTEYAKRLLRKVDSLLRQCRKLRK